MILSEKVWKTHRRVGMPKKVTKELEKSDSISSSE
jgi:hypothetical protein